MHHGEGVTIRVLRWVCWCALAESVGMTAASGAAKAAQHFTDTEFPSTTALLIGLGLVIAGGLVEVQAGQCFRQCALQQLLQLGIGQRLQHVDLRPR